MSATCGSANIITGLSHAVSDRPELNQIAPSARQRQQHRDEHRQRQQHRQRAERKEAEERDHRVGWKLAARRAAEQSHELRGERDHEQRHEHRASKAGEFPEQRALKDHAILSLWNLA
jgi:hypothetical protein